MLTCFRDHSLFRMLIEGSLEHTRWDAGLCIDRTFNHKFSLFGKCDSADKNQIRLVRFLLCCWNASRKISNIDWIDYLCQPTYVDMVLTGRLHDGKGNNG